MLFHLVKNTHMFSCFYQSMKVLKVVPIQNQDGLFFIWFLYMQSILVHFFVEFVFSFVMSVPVMGPISSMVLRVHIDQYVVIYRNHFLGDTNTLLILQSVLPQQKAFMPLQHILFSLIQLVIVRFWIILCLFSSLVYCWLFTIDYWLQLLL